MNTSEKENSQPRTSFAEKHPILNFLLGVLLLLFLSAIVIIIVLVIVKYVGIGISVLIEWLSDTVPKIDAVVIVALITGAVSILGVIISSVFGKIIEYRKARQEYLAKKREGPYADFISVIYKIQKNVNGTTPYTEKEMSHDISLFSQSITLWGSPRVVKKWLKFRENATNPKTATDNLFLVDDIMNEMRRDMGLKRVKKGNLLSFIINDIEKLSK